MILQTVSALFYIQIVFGAELSSRAPSSTAPTPLRTKESTTRTIQAFTTESLGDSIEEGTTRAPQHSLCAIILKEESASCTPARMVIRENNVSLAASKNWRLMAPQLSPDIPPVIERCNISAILFPNCSLYACTSENFGGICVYTELNSTDLDISTYDLTKAPIAEIGSLNCFCNNGNAETVEKRPENPDIPGMCPSGYVTNSGGSRACATIYSDPFCHGMSGSMDNNTLMAAFVDGMWITERFIDKSKSIRSAEINPNCAFVLCEKTNFLGLCETKEGGRNGMNYNMHEETFQQEKYGSAACMCGTDGPTEIIARLRSRAVYGHEGYSSYGSYGGSSSRRYAWCLVIPVPLACYLAARKYKQSKSSGENATGQEMK